MKVHTVAYPVVTPEDKFPEQDAGRVYLTDESIAIAMSGGGSRSFSCAIGAYRALSDGRVQKATYMSCASGGTWATSIFNFAQLSEVELVGTSTRPADLDLETLRKSNGSMCDRIDANNFKPFEKALEILADPSVTLETLWEKTMGTLLLGPYGLDGKLFADNEEDVLDIVARNPRLKRENFAIPRNPQGPFIIMNGTLEGPRKATSTASVSLQMTTLYCGSPYYPNNAKVKYTYNKCCGLVKKTTKNIVGGGFIEAFAFGSKSPRNSKGQRGGPVTSQSPPKGGLFSLDRAVGISSAAFVMAFKDQAHLASDLVDPVEQYWPILSDTLPGPQKSMNYTCGDGGNFENTGLLAALQRGVTKAVVFINSSKPLMNDPYLQNEANRQPCSTVEPIDTMVDDDFISLFGIGQSSDGWNYKYNQVFAQSDLQEKVLPRMVDSYNNGYGCVAYAKLMLLDNNYWGIKGEKEVDILFVYNDNAWKFRVALPQETQESINSPHGKFANYPHYKTMFNNDEAMSLRKEQINLLAATLEFIVNHNEESFTKIFD